MIAVQWIVTKLKDKHCADFITGKRINGYNVDLRLLFPDFEISNRDKAATLLFVEIMNEFPGLFGVIWHNTNERRAEIGL